VLGQPEVHHLHVPLRCDHDIGRLEIAMDDVPAMSGVQRLGQLVGDVDDLTQR
jgi:hypothetical protein